MQKKQKKNKKLSLKKLRKAEKYQSTTKTMLKEKLLKQKFHNMAFQPTKHKQTNEKPTICFWKRIFSVWKKNKSCQFFTHDLRRPLCISERIIVLQFCSMKIV